VSRWKKERRVSQGLLPLLNKLPGGANGGSIWGTIVTGRRAPIVTGVAQTTTSATAQNRQDYS